MNNKSANLVQVYALRKRNAIIINANGATTKY
jgi:hypothetical protein